MCLSVNKGVPKKTTGYGWKVLVLRKRRLTSPLYPWPRHVWNNKWKSAKWATNTGGFHTNTGAFHIFLHRREALEMYRSLKRKREMYRYEGEIKLCRVQYRKALIWGLGDGGWNQRARVVLVHQARLAP
jgi:hypothetical protein